MSGGDFKAKTASCKTGILGKVKLRTNTRLTWGVSKHWNLFSLSAFAESAEQNVARPTFGRGPG
jgi:hypothetical protein